MSTEEQTEKPEGEVISLKAAADRKKKKLKELKQEEKFEADKAALERALGFYFDKKTYSMPEVIDICMRMNAEFDLVLKSHQFDWGRISYAEQLKPRPMSEAPRDGTVILGFFRCTGYPFVVKFNDSRWKSANSVGWFPQEHLIAWLPCPTYTGEAVK